MQIPNEPTLTESLTLAWSDRGERAFDVLNSAMEAPALFTPAAVEGAMAEAQEATRQARYWSGQADADALAHATRAGRPAALA